MNDTEKIDELMTELDNIDKENQEGDVPVITKEYNIGDEEPTTEQEKTKIMEEIQENVEQAPVEEPKQETPEMTPLPNKDKKNKKLMIILIVATVALVIAIILLSVFVKPQSKKEKPKETVKDDVISYEEYKKIITAYGDSVTKAYKELKQKNKNITNVTPEDLDIDYKDHEVTCKEMHFNYDKSVYLDDCKIKGYESQYNFHYGEKENPENMYKIYIYKTLKYNIYNYSYDIEEVRKLEQDSAGDLKAKLLKEITCKDKSCKVYLNSFGKSEYFIFKDADHYYQMCVSNNMKNELKALAKVQERINVSQYNDDGSIRIIELTDSITNKVGFYSVKKDKIITKIEYDRDYSTEYMRKAGYMAALKTESDNNQSLYILNALTGEQIKVIKCNGNITFVSDKEIYSKHYYLIVDNNGKKSTYYNDNFEIAPKEINEYDEYPETTNGEDEEDIEDGDENEE